MTTRLKDLAQLAQLREALSRSAREEAAARRVQEQQAAKQSTEAEEFRAAVGSVTPLTIRQRVEHDRPPHPPVAHQRLEDDRQVLIASVSDEFEIDTLLHTDAELSFRRPGFGPDCYASCAAANGRFRITSTCTDYGSTRRANCLAGSCVRR